MTATVAAVIVTFNPDAALLKRLIDLSAGQVDIVILVDNGEGAEIRPLLGATNVELIAMGSNRGLAAAQNAGIARAREKGAGQVVIFDQDSEPAPDFIARLMAGMAQAGPRTAAVGPRYVDSRRTLPDVLSPFIQLRGMGWTRVHPAAGSDVVAVDFLISSGSLISMPALDAIGLMQEKLFIEYIDLDWSLRARKAGWNLYGIWDAVMEHSIGDKHVTAWGHEFAVHSPLRHYYLIRNAVWLCLQDWPWRWRLAIAANAAKKFAIYSVFMPRPWVHFSFMCQGIWHGLRRRMGKFDA